MTTMSMKRSREDDREVEALAMANCLMLLNQIDKARSSMLPTGRVFECKTCNRQFPSFQALGGHRASHKRPKLMAGDLLPHVAVKPKKHECSICGVEFALGQALGGHMRRHRAALSDHGMEKSTTADGDNDRNLEKAVPFLKRSNSSKRVWGLDLNLMPPYEMDLKLGW